MAQDWSRERGHGIVEDIAIAAPDQALEYLLMGLRISEGIDIVRYQALAGRNFTESRVADLTSLGLVVTDGSRIRATARGRPLLNALIAELAA